MKYYGVRIGRNPGIYTDWNECKKSVTGFKGAEFKGFKTLKEAEDYVASDSTLGGSYYYSDNAPLSDDSCKS